MVTKTGEMLGKRKTSADSTSSGKKKTRPSLATLEKKGKSRDRSDRSDSKAKVTGDFDASVIGKDGSKAVFQIPTGSKAYEVGPILLSTTDFPPPRDIDYTLHHKVLGDSSSSRGASLKDRLILAGENESMDYVAWNFDIDANVGESEKARRESRGYSGEYMVGVYDPDKSTVTLRAAPVFTLTRTIKALNNGTLDIASTSRDWQARVLARRGLGEAFGNRKQKAKARNEDRMKVDTSNMSEVMKTMQEGIEQATADMPTEEDMREEANEARPIPPPNLEALTPQEAYPLHVLIPDNIFRLLNIKHLQVLESAGQISRALPYEGPGKSTWLKDRLWPLIQASQMSRNKNGIKDEDGIAPSGGSGILKSSSGAKAKLRILWYIALLWGFIKLVAGRRDKGGEKESLLKKLKLDQAHGGEAILDDLFARFSQTERGSSRGQVTGFTETKLYAYMFALCLHAESFSLDPTILSRDLGLGPTKVTEIFKSLGCTSAKKNVMQADGTSKSERALVLKCPLELPKPRRGPQKRK